MRIEALHVVVARRNSNPHRLHQQISSLLFIPNPPGDRWSVPLCESGKQRNLPSRHQYAGRILENTVLVLIQHPRSQAALRMPHDALLVPFFLSTVTSAPNVLPGRTAALKRESSIDYPVRTFRNDARHSRVGAQACSLSQARTYQAPRSSVTTRTPRWLRLARTWKNSLRIGNAKRPERVNDFASTSLPGHVDVIETMSGYSAVSSPDGPAGTTSSAAPLSHCPCQA